MLTQVVLKGDPHFSASLIKFNFCADDSDPSRSYPLLCADVKHDGLGHPEGGGTSGPSLEPLPAGLFTEVASA